MDDRREPWLVPPRLRTVAEGEERRHATWLELFFDLVFVVPIAELARQGQHWLGVSLKLGAVAVTLALLLAEAVLPPAAVAATLVGILATVVYLELALIPGSPAAS